MRRRSLLVLFCAVGLCCGSLTVQGQTSISNSQIVEPLWQALLKATADLPSQMQSWKIDTLEQVQTLHQNMLSLQTETQSLRDSNASLQASNAISTQLNEDLTQSLAASQASLLTSKAELAKSQTLLQNSILSITKAQVDAKALEAQNSVLRIGCITFGVGLGVVAVYEGGRALKVW